MWLQQNSLFLRLAEKLEALQVKLVIEEAAEAKS